MRTPLATTIRLTLIAGASFLSLASVVPPPQSRQGAEAPQAQATQTAQAPTSPSGDPTYCADACRTILACQGATASDVIASCADGCRAENPAPDNTRRMSEMSCADLTAMAGHDQAAPQDDAPRAEAPVQEAPRDPVGGSVCRGVDLLGVWGHLDDRYSVEVRFLADGRYMFRGREADGKIVTHWGDWVLVCPEISASMDDAGAVTVRIVGDHLEFSHQEITRCPGTKCF